MKVGLSSDARYAQHHAPQVLADGSMEDPAMRQGHPEHPGRLTAIEAELASRGIQPRTVAIAARPATREELERVHRASYLDALEITIKDRGAGWLDPDTFYAPHSFEVAQLAAGATLECALAVADGKVDTAFALVRPPGHHATSDRAMGFCLVNNVAVAAAALKARGLRVSIFDWDVHHGNGTEAIFYEDAQVQYVSMHEWPQYPGTGARIDVGRGAGMGNNLNVPLPSGTNGAEYLQAFRTSVVPALKRFAPDVLLVSAGFDAHREDPLGGLALDDETYRTLTLELLAIQPKLALVLEGGYHLPALARSAALVIETLVEFELLAATVANRRAQRIP